MRPLVPREAGGEREAEHEQRGGDPAHRATTSRSARRAAAAPRPPRAAARSRRGCGRSGWRSTSRRRAPRRSARRPPGAPSPSRTVRSAHERGELGVVGRDEHRACPRRRARAGRAASASLWPRSMPRVGSSRQTTAGGSPCSTIASASRWRSPPERSRGWRSARCAEAGGLERRGGQLLRHALGDAGSRRGSAAAARRGRRARSGRGVGCVEPGGEPQQRRLARAVAAHQRDPLPGREREVHAPQHRRPARDLEPDAVERERGGRLRRGGAGARGAAERSARRDRSAPRSRPARGRAARRGRP